MNGFLDLMYEVFPNVSRETKSRLHEHIRKKDLYSKRYLSFFSGINNYERDLKENVLTDKLYMGELPNDNIEYVADLNMVSSLSSEYFHNKIIQGGAKKVSSLSNNGYYFFLAKITLHLMRPESLEIKREQLLSS